MNNIGIIFSKPKDFVDPMSPMGAKRPVYEELVSRCKENGMNCVVVSTKAYKGQGLFDWYWEISPNKSLLVDKQIKLDLGYDRSGGLRFPLENDNFKVIDNLEFKKFAWNKWEAYKLLGEYMPQTVLFDDEKSIDKIKTEWVVLKPSDGLKGMGIYIGPKAKADSFEKLPNRIYLAQEFVDTRDGVKEIASSIHDIRVVIINGKAVWSHVRIPPIGEFKSNVAGGGELREIRLESIPDSINKVVHKVSKVLYNRFDNPIYSIDFGIDKNQKPYVFEINDQIGFPKPFMINKDNFINEMIINFKSKL